MHNLDELFYYLVLASIVAAVIAGFVVGFYTGPVSIRAINAYITKNKKKIFLNSCNH